MGSDTTQNTPEPTDIVPALHVMRLSTTTDPFELFEEARSLSGVSDAHARSGRDSDASSERMNRIDGLLEGVVVVATEAAKVAEDKDSYGASMLVETAHAGDVGKQHKVNQSKKDTGQNAPVDKIGGVICSDIKGLMTPRDRHGKRCMINFVDHSSNYVRAFLAKNKVGATKKFKYFLVFFEKEYNCRTHVLRTDCGGEYMNVKNVCRTTDVRRQVSEANNQASNGKAEQMQRTILNMVRCMLFASGLPLKFWGYAVEYTAYVLNRSGCSANPRRMSPIDVLTGKCPDMADIVTFCSPCTAYRDPLDDKGRCGHDRREERRDQGLQGIHSQGYGSGDDTANRERGGAQNVQFQAQLKKEDPEMWRSIEEREEAASQKEQTPKKKKQVKGKKKKKAHGAGGVGEEAEGYQASEGTTGQPTPTATRAVPAARTRTRHMGAKHVSVQVVHAVVAADSRNDREAMRDARADKWKEQQAAAHEVGLQDQDACDGTVECYKGRLVVCGNEQEYGVDYIVTFSAVLDMTTGKLIFVMAHVWGVPARHGDVPSAYAKADKEEGLEIHLYIPDAMAIPDELLLALFGASPQGADEARVLPVLHRQLLVLLARRGGVRFVGVYVDDLLVTGTRSARVDTYFEVMAVLEFKDLGVVLKFLGIGFEYDEARGGCLSSTK
ncbi:unnamed protein product [Phytophthora fragariaefolia]|uniref:Unnamed protein product n=1 Tax=Phytophthora fragariaefolia TaxID=1490495 RepID=A0A9W6Y115_9STRA|nr:unnamed protein product [Phytophthora fragariaefolia]